jgi:hypothetical protein
MSKARLLWIGYTGKRAFAHAETIKRLWDKDLIEFCAGTGVKSQPIDSEILSEPLIPHNEVLFGNYHAIESSFSITLDNEIYREFSSFEGETLRMMDRLCGREPHFIFEYSFNSRRTMFIRHCSFWRDYLIKKKISHIVFCGVPHEVFTHVVYKIAKTLSIETIIVAPEKTGSSRKKEGIFLQSDLLPRSMHQSLFFLSESIEDIGVWRLSEKIKSLDEKFPVKLLYGQPFLDGTAGRSQSDLVDFDKRLVWPYLRSFVKMIRQIPKRPRVLLGALKNSFVSLCQYFEHIRIAVDLNHESPVILFCLAYQPEESTSPRAGIFVEQKLAINAIVNNLPSGWILRVREHPDQYGRRRPRPFGFLREISKIANVEIVPIDEDSRKSLDSARIVAGSAGTMCLESWALRKPLLLFGHMLLKKAPNVYFVESHADLKSALEVATLNCLPDEYKLANFKSWTASNSYVGTCQKIKDASLLEATVNNLEGILERWFFLTSTA